jgi:hypothetical protein
MFVADQVDGVADVPLNVTMLAPCVAPKFVPVIVIVVPTGPPMGESAVSVGAGGAGAVTVKGSPLLTQRPTVTTTLPVVAPAGTGTVMLAADHVEGVARVPLNVTMLAPCVAPKPLPAIVTTVPVLAAGGDRLTIVGLDDRAAASARAGAVSPVNRHTATINTVRDCARDRDTSARR